MADDLVLDDVVVSAPAPVKPQPPAPPAKPDAPPTPAYPDDTVVLEIGGQAFTGWTDVQIVRGIELMPSFATLQLTERLPGKPTLFAIDPGATCRVMIGQDLVITGFVDEYSARADFRTHQIRVVVRSSTQDLVDCAAGVTDGEETKATLTYSAATVLQLATDLCTPFGITVTEPDGEGEALASVGDGIPQFTIQLGQTVYDVLEPRVRWRQLLMLDGTDGNLVLAKVGTKKAASGFTMPGTALQAQVSFRKQERFTIYLPAAFSFDAAFEVQSASGSRGNFLQPVKDEAAFKDQPRWDKKLRYRPHFVVSDQFINSIKLAEALAKWEKARRFGRSQKLVATVALWRDSAGTLWSPNTLAPVNMPVLKLAKLEWLISEVAYLKGEAGTRAQVTLMPREAFLPEPLFLTAFDPQIAQAQGEALRSQQNVLTDNSRSISNPGAGANGNPRGGDGSGL